MTTIISGSKERPLIRWTLHVPLPLLQRKTTANTWSKVWWTMTINDLWKSGFEFESNVLVSNQIWIWISYITLVSNMDSYVLIYNLAKSSTALQKTHGFNPWTGRRRLAWRPAFSTTGCPPSCHADALTMWPLWSCSVVKATATHLDWSLMIFIYVFMV